LLAADFGEATILESRQPAAHRADPKGVVGLQMQAADVFRRQSVRLVKILKLAFLEPA
jgi:hypothetical protein